MEAKGYYRLESHYGAASEEAPELYDLGGIDSSAIFSESSGMARFLGVAIAIGYLTVAQGCSTTGQPKTAGVGTEQIAVVNQSDCPASIFAHMDRVLKVAFSPDGRILATGSEDKTVKLWEMPSGRLLRVLHSGFDLGHELAFSPDGRWLATGYIELMIWDVAAGRLEATLNYKNVGMIRCFAFSPEGSSLAVGSDDGTVRICSLPSGKLLSTLGSMASKASIRALAISPDGRLLAAGSLDKSVKLWELPSGKPLATLSGLEGHMSWIDSLAISPDGKILASVADDKVLKLWELPTGRIMRTLSGFQEPGMPSNSPVLVAFSPDGSRLAAGYYKTIHIYELPSFRRIARIPKIDANSLSFSPDGGLLATVANRDMKLLDPSSGRLAMILSGHKGYIDDFAYSPDGKLLATASMDRSVKIWALPSGASLSCLFDPEAVPSTVNVIAVSTKDDQGRDMMKYLQEGSAIPAGMVCTCNCVPGHYVAPAAGGSSGSGTTTVCTCNQICTCVPVLR